MAIWQDLVDDHGFPARYASVRRFVATLRQQPAVEARAVITTDPGEEAQVDYGEGPMVRDADTGKYKRTRLFVLTLGYSRKAVRLLVHRSSAQVLGQVARAGLPAAGRHHPCRRPRQPQGGRPRPGHLRPDAESALPRRARPLRRRPPAVPRPRSRSKRQGRSQRRPRPENAAAWPPLRAPRRWSGVPGPLGAALGRHPHPRNDQAPGRRHVRGRTPRARPVAPRAVPLLPVRPPHRASGRLRRGRLGLLLGAARMDRTPRRRAVGRRPRPPPRPGHRPAAARAPAYKTRLASHRRRRPARPHPAEDPRPARRRQAGRSRHLHRLRPHPPP